MYTKKDGQGGAARAPTGQISDCSTNSSKVEARRKSGPKSHISSSIMTEIERGTRREKKKKTDRYWSGRTAMNFVSS